MSHGHANDLHVKCGLREYGHASVHDRVHGYRASAHARDHDHVHHSHHVHDHGYARAVDPSPPAVLVLPRT